ncbi:MAG: endonuclease/exonuclease/phosphatase family metal-dependent hydrolase, partial [Myxococcota bacterium]
PDGAYQWTPARAETKFRRLAAAIDRLDVDTIALCEIGSERALGHLNSLLSNPYETAVYRRGEERRGIECAVLSRAPLADAPRLLIVHDLERADVWDKPTRGVLVVPLRLREERVDLVVNHWPAPNPSNPRRPAQRLTAGTRVAEHALGCDNPMVVVGDFNSNPFEPGLLALTAEQRLYSPIVETMKSVLDSDQPPPIDALRGLLKSHPEIFGTFHFGGSNYWTAFDQILLSAELGAAGFGWRYQAGSHRVVRDTELVDGLGRPIGSHVASQIGLDTGISDHLPVRVTLEYQEAK